MKKTFALPLIFAAIVLAPFFLSWGVFGHEHINRGAVMALPESSLKSFFYNHIDFITQESTVPDLRRGTLKDKAEGARHYIDLENFRQGELPRTMDEARRDYPDSFLQKNGILPWYIQDMTAKLTKAFKEKNKTEILFLSADLGHYIGDAHMPLHTSANHNGQLTNQVGIHGFWESQLPNLFGEGYNYYVGEAAYIPDISAETFRIISESHLLADTMLAADWMLTAKFGGKGILVTDAAGQVILNDYKDPTHTTAYAAEYHKALNGMVERQLQRAIKVTSSYWYTAWVNAGKPDLSSLDPQELTDAHAKRYLKEQRLYKKGRLFGIGAQNGY